MPILTFSGMLYVSADKAYLIDRKFCCRSVDHGVYALALGTAGSLLHPAWTKISIKFIFFLTYTRTS
jgi:hypothetical protein